MKKFGIGTHGATLLITGLLLSLLPDSVDTKATILSGIDKPTGNAYEDVFIADQEEQQQSNTTILPGSNQSISTNNATELH
jgi:hypothetical protein